MNIKSDMLSEHSIKTGIEGLDEFIRGFPRGGLIVISGSPGTGKTAMAASFIYEGALKYGEPGVYVSLIEDERRFYSYMQGFGYDFEKLKDKGLFRYLELPTLLSPAIGSLTNTIIEEVEKVNAKRLVIDSYTALNDMFKSKAEARTFLHTFLSKIVKSLGCTTLLIREETHAGEKHEYGFEEFLADGIIHLKANRLEGKPIRELTILKMRGNRIENPDACFTLHGGFKILVPTKTSTSPKISRIEPLADKPGTYITGIPDLDEVIGGFPDRSVILIEVDPKLTSEQMLCFKFFITAHHLLKGRPCIHIPSGGISVGELQEILRSHGLSEDVIENFLKSPLRELGLSEVMTKLKPDEAYEVLRKFRRYCLEVRKRYEKPVIKILGVDRVAHIFGELFTDIAYYDADETRRNGGLSIWILKPTLPELSDRLAPLADIYLKVTQRHGCILIHGVKPRTPLYAMKFEEDKPRLIPMI